MYSSIFPINFLSLELKFIVGMFFNHPELRLWQDEALMAAVQGVETREQLKTSIKTWAQQHLPAQLAQLQQLQQEAGAQQAGVAAQGAESE